MNGFAQVFHVVRKDLRQHAWLAVLMTAAVAYDTYTAVEGIDAGSLVRGYRFPIPFLPSGLSLLVGILVAAFTVQSDSPARDDAFWSTRPLAPAAVFGAKLLLIGGLAVLLPLAGQAVALVAHGAPAAALPAHLGEGLVRHGSVVAAAALVAGLTPDLRSFFVVFVASVLGWMSLDSEVLRRMSDVPGWRGYPAYGLLRSAAILSVGAGVLFYQYRTRSRWRSVALVAFAMGVWLVAMPGLGSSALMAGGDPASIDATAPEHLVATDLELGPLILSRGTLASDPRHQNWHLWTTLSLADADPAHDYYLENLEVWIAVGDRPAVRRRTFAARTLLHRASDVPGADEWADEFPLEGLERVSIATLTPDEAEGVADGRFRLELRGEIAVQRPREVGLLPVREGAASSSANHRVEIEGVTHGPDGPVIGIRSEALVSRLSGGVWMEREDYRFALVPADRSVGYPLHAPHVGSGSHPLVVAGAMVRTLSRSLTLRPQGAGTGDAPPPDLSRVAADATDLLVLGAEPAGAYPLVVDRVDPPVERR